MTRRAVSLAHHRDSSHIKLSFIFRTFSRDHHRVLALTHARTTGANSRTRAPHTHSLADRSRVDLVNYCTAGVLVMRLEGVNRHKVKHL